METRESYEVAPKIADFQTPQKEEQGLSGTSEYTIGSGSGGNTDRSHSILTSLECLVDNIEDDVKPQPIHRGWSKRDGKSTTSSGAFHRGWIKRDGKSTTSWRNSIQRGGGTSVLGGESEKRARSPGSSNQDGNDEKRARSSGTSNERGNRVECDDGTTKRTYHRSRHDRSETFEKNKNDDDLLIDLRFEKNKNDDDMLIDYGNIYLGG